MKIMTASPVSTGLAIFSILLGAGNLIYPLKVGMDSGDKILWGLLGFIATAVVLPLAGFFSMILFNGNYRTFFYRLGKPVGPILIFLCMLFLGPLIAIPRLVTLSHTMLAPFLKGTLVGNINPTSSLIYALIFLGTTFFCTYRENRIILILGTILGPFLLLSLAIIVIKGLLLGGSVIHNPASALSVFETNFIRGYETLDLLGALFFSSIVLAILKLTMEKTVQNNPRLLPLVACKASILAVSLLLLVYIGMSFLGMYYGHELEAVNSGELFSALSFRIFGNSGTVMVALTVVVACISTSMGLAAIVAEYVQEELFRNRIGYVPALVLVLLASVPYASAGLTTILELTGGIMLYVGYPVLIVLTFVNILYQCIGFKPVKLPVACVFLVLVLLRPEIQKYVLYLINRVCGVQFYV